MQTDPNAFLYLFFEPIAPFLDDPDVSEIMINGPARIYVERRGRIENTNACFCSENALRAAAMNVARSVGRMLGEENPILEARLPDGARIEAIIPPLSRTGTVVSIRKFRKEKLTPADLYEMGLLGRASSADLRACLGRRIHIGAGTAKTMCRRLNGLGFTRAQLRKEIENAETDCEHGQDQGDPESL